MDVIPLDASLVKGSHGRLTDHPDDGPLIISDRAEILGGKKISAVDVKALLLNAVFA
jgi:hypothetical protein